MLQKKWFKVFIYIVTSALFFAAASILIAAFCPTPTEMQIMSYMSGMMKAMESSLMGLSMTIEGDAELRKIIYRTSSATTILIIGAVVAGDYVRYSRRKKNG